MGRNYAAVPHDYIEKLEELTDEEFGRLIRSLLLYSRAGEAFSPKGNERFFVQLVKITEDTFQSAFDETDRKKTERARKAAEARWSAQASNEMQGDAQASVSTESNAKDAKNKINNKDKINILQINNKVKEKENNKEKKNDVGFDRFWSVYPNKKGKGAARTAFAKAIAKGVSVEDLITAVERQKHSRQWTRDNGDYIPHPATWLNQERWEDAIEAEPEEDDSWNPFLQIAKEEHQKNEQGANGGGPVDNEGGLPFFLSGNG